MKKFIPTDHELVAMMPKIGHSGFIVYTVLQRYMNNKSRKCFPSQKKIAELTGYKNRQIVSAIKKLKDCNMLSVQKRQRLPNLYYLTHKGEWNKVVLREENTEPMSHRFILPDVYYEERINEVFPVVPPPDTVKCVTLKDDIIETVYEQAFYCPNCFLVMTPLTTKEMDCPWCEEHITVKELTC